MTPLPQELVDKIIDELACSHPGDSDSSCCAPYSLISKVWVERAQEYHFNYVNIYGMDELEKWRRCITPDPLGVSRHTRHLRLGQIKTIEGYEGHLDAFNGVESLSISYCGCFMSTSVVQCFAQMGSSLVQLSFDSRTTARTIATLLAMLPLLEIFAIYPEVDDDACEIELACSIPFFKNSNSFRLLGHPPKTLNWVPPNPQLSDLKINLGFFLNEAAYLNQWISASFETLTSLEIDGFPKRATPPNPFTRLDLSPCRALASLMIPMWLNKPGIVVDTLLPTINSSQLAYVQLNSEDDPNYPPPVDYQSWAIADHHLQRLAKLFSSEHPGEKMEVMVSEYHWAGPPTDEFVERLGSEKFLPRLKEEAEFRLGSALDC